MHSGSRAGNYHERINRVMDHVYASVDGDLSLDTLAGIAGFSAYHFHRLFKTFTGENLNDFVRRARLERAAALLRASPASTLTRAAYDSGFSSLSSFSRSFKQHFGTSPGNWSRAALSGDSKIRQAGGPEACYVRAAMPDTQDGEFTAEITGFPASRMACIRIRRPWMPGRLAAGYERLKHWLEARGMTLHGRLLIGVSPDDPDLTPADNIRYDFCAGIEEEMAGEGEISIRMMPACRIVSVRCTGDLAKVERAWEYLYRTWLPQSEYEPANLPAMEIYRSTPDELGWERYDIECCIPILLSRE